MLPTSRFAPEAVLDWYRLRWQVEVVCERFQSVAALGPAPKRGGASSRPWLYGKLFTARLTEKLMARAHAVSRCGCDIAARQHRSTERARITF